MFCEGFDTLLIFKTVVSTFTNDSLEDNRSFDVRSKKSIPFLNKKKQLALHFTVCFNVLVLNFG